MFSLLKEEEEEGGGGGLQCISLVQFYFFLQTVTIN